MCVLVEYNSQIYNLSLTLLSMIAGQHSVIADKQSFLRIQEVD